MFGNKKKKEEQAVNLVQTGGRAVGTISDVKDTGVTINDMDIRVKVVYRIEPLDGSNAFDGEKTEMVSRVKLPQIGARYPVFFDRDDPNTFAVVTGIDDESGRQNIVQMFGDAFGADASGIGMIATGGAAAAAAPAAEDPLDKLEKLGKLHASGVLTDEEFAAQKAAILGSS